VSTYFAYGANCSSRQMASRCPGAVALGPACLEGFRLAFDRPSRRWGGYAAGVVPDPTRHTWGVAWQVDEGHLARLDRFEGVAVGAYLRESVVIRVAGRSTRAEVYRIVTPAAAGAPSGRYLHTIIEGAREFGLPREWLLYLHSLRA
jgi:gamma-glutamylcyclotransferase (GGCT)/AIG2-like uncharacterized protein YtfP